MTALIFVTVVWLVVFVGGAWLNKNTPKGA